MKRVFVLAALIAATACTTSVPPMVDMRGKDVAQFNLDYVACKHENPGVVFLPEQVMAECLTAKGWTLLQ